METRKRHPSCDAFPRDKTGVPDNFFLSGGLLSGAFLDGDFRKTAELQGFLRVLRECLAPFASTALRLERLQEKRNNRPVNGQT